MSKTHRKQIISENKILSRRIHSDLNTFLSFRLVTTTIAKTNKGQIKQESVFQKFLILCLVMLIFPFL